VREWSGRGGATPYTRRPCRCDGTCRLSSVGQSDALVMRRSWVRFPQAAPRNCTSGPVRRSSQAVVHSRCPHVVRKPRRHEVGHGRCLTSFDGRRRRARRRGDRAGGSGDRRLVAVVGRHPHDDHVYANRLSGSCVEMSGGWFWDVDRGHQGAPLGPPCPRVAVFPGAARADHAWQLVSARDRGHPKGDKSVFMAGSRADDRADETSVVSGWRSLASVDAARGMARPRG
jgi:hypothetical protein